MTRTSVVASTEAPEPGPHRVGVGAALAALLPSVVAVRAVRGDLRAALPWPQEAAGPEWASPRGAGGRFERVRTELRARGHFGSTYLVATYVPSRAPGTG